MEIRTFEAHDAAAVVELWRACQLTRDWNDPHKDINRKVAVDDELFLVGVVDGRIVGSVMAGYDGHRGWINYLAVHPNFQRSGFAVQLMSEAERRLGARGCPKVNLQVRFSNVAAVGFYDRIGYEPDEVLSFGKRLEHDVQ
jgi:ribosomal protein S18 acetylase RimI-like enzyme